MTPIPFPAATHVFKAPSQWDSEQHGPCVDLHVMVTDGVYTSAWKPSTDELMTLNEGGLIYLSVIGGQPPVAISVGQNEAACRTCRYELNDECIFNGDCYNMSAWADGGEDSC